MANIKDIVNIIPKSGLIFEGGKSFYVFADNKTECFKCGYCVLSSVDYLHIQEHFRKLKIGVLPSKIHPMFRNIPVAVNNAYGDAGLQWANTKDKLEALANDGHKGIVGIITKDWFRESGMDLLKELKTDLDLVVLQSVSNLPQNIEPSSYFLRIKNIKKLVNNGINVLPYFRPIIPEYNDNPKVIESTIKDCAIAGVKGIVYSGLMGTPQVIKLLQNRVKHPIKVPQGYPQWMIGHKLVAKGTRNLIEDTCRYHGIEPFRKTSCGVSHATGKTFDYNIHYVRPEKYNCVECVMGCANHASKEKDMEIEPILKIIKAEGTIEYNREIGECKLEQVCTNPCTSCSLSNGTKIHLEGTYTLGEISIIRWLTGFTVFADEQIDSNRMFFMYKGVERKCNQT